ncbi:MAG TPA: hypothetical protein VF828_02280 [Patescibacteria group bacterium]
MTEHIECNENCVALKIRRFLGLSTGQAELHCDGEDYKPRVVSTDNLRWCDRPSLRRTSSFEPMRGRASSSRKNSTM